MTTTLRIEKKAKTKHGKSRTFHANLLAYLQADHMWEGGRTETRAVRPVALWIGGTEPALRPFVANLRKGRKAEMLVPTGWSRKEARGRIEILRSAGYDYVWQRTAGGEVIVTIYLHELFAMDPGLIDSSVCQFISAPPRSWVDLQLGLLAATPGLWDRVLQHARCLGLMDGGEDSPIGVPVALTEDGLRLATVLAYSFCNSLDRRTKRPLINSLEFYVQIYLSLLGQGGASYPKDHEWKWAVTKRSAPLAHGLERLGIPNAAAMRVGQDELDDFLADQASIYREHGGVN